MTAASGRRLTDHLAEQVPAILVLSMSLWLMVTMAHRRADGEFPRHQLSRMARQGELTRHEIERYLEAGVPLRQFVGFNTLTDPLLGTEYGLQEVIVFDTEGEIVFHNSSPEFDSAIEVDDPLQERFNLGHERGSRPDGLARRKQDAYFKLSLTLADKFEDVGSLVLLMPKSSVEAQIQARIRGMTRWMVACIVLFGVCLFAIRGVYQNKNRGILLSAYVIAFVVASCLVNWSLQVLFVEGTKASTAALGESLAQRFGRIQQLGLGYDDFSDIGDLMEDVNAANPNIEYAAIVSEGQIRYHSDRASIRGRDSRDTTLELTTPIPSSNDVLVLRVSARQASVWYGFRDMVLNQAPAFFSLLSLSTILLWLFDHYLIRGFQSLKVPAIFVLCCAFVLLFYVGVGEAYRAYPKLVLDNLAAQGDAVKDDIESFLKSGVALNQIAGFDTLTSGALAANPRIASIEIIDAEGSLLFANSSGSSDSADLGSAAANLNLDSYQNLDMANAEDHDYRFFENASSYRAVLPLRNKFEAVGDLVLTMSSRHVADRVRDAFRRLALWMGAIVLGFAALVFVSDRVWPKRDPLKLFYGLAFLFAASLVLQTLTQIYASGIEGKARAVSMSVAKRLESALDLGFSIDDFSGVRKFLRDHQSLDSDLESIGLIQDGRYAIHTDPQLDGTAWHSDASFFEFDTPLRQVGDVAPRSAHAYHVSVRIPKRAVYTRLLRSIKNFLVLFLATAFFANLFLELVHSLNLRKRLSKVLADDDASKARLRADTRQVLIKTLYFLVVFMEGLFASFLPQYLQNVAIGNQMDSASASILFTLYFAAFAVSLIPSGSYADKYGVKYLLLLGVLATTASVYLMTWFNGFYALMVLRGLAGLGQGMVFIGVQSFILMVAQKARTTRGTSIIVLGYNTGMISGTAIGALLIVYMGPEKVFLLSAAVGLFAMTLVLFAIPEVGGGSGVKRDGGLRAIRAFLSRLSVLMRDMRFLKTIFLIGLTTKATLTGVVVYGLPLVMARLGYLQDDIGQVLMFYAAGVLVSNMMIPALADRMGNTSAILFGGAMGSGLGLIVIGLARNAWLGALLPFSPTILLILGISVLGLAHGFIHAPIVTHIAFSHAAEVLGKSTTTSVYRFLERFGHIGGPLVIGQILVLSHYRISAFTYVGGAVLLFGMLFVLWRGSLDKVEADPVDES